MTSSVSEFLDRLSIAFGNIAMLAVFPVAFMAVATLH
jgi:hypothetical protein